LSDISGAIAYDWINKKIYITDARRRQILMANVDGTDVVTILNVNKPVSIALHPCRGYSCIFSYLFLYRYFFYCSWCVFHFTRGFIELWKNSKQARI